MASTAEITNTAGVWNSPESTFDSGSATHDGVTGIGDRFELELDYTLSGDWESGDPFNFGEEVELFVSFAEGIQNGEYWMPRGTYPTAGFFAVIPTGLSVGDRIALTGVRLGEAMQILESSNPMTKVVEFEYLGATSFKIRINHRHALSLQEFLRPVPVKSLDLFAKTVRRGEVESNEYPSVYNSERSLGVFAYIRREKEQLDDTIREESFYDYRLRFWDQDPDGVSTAYPLTVEFEQDRSPAENISAQIDTVVKLSFDKPAGLEMNTTQSRLLVWEEGEEGGKVWYEQLRWSEHTLFTNGADAQIEGLIYAPSSAFRENVATNKYEGSFTMKATELDASKKYRIAVLAVFDGDPSGTFEHVQPMLTPALRPDDAPVSCLIDMIPTIVDYQKTYDTHHLEKATAGDRYTLRLCTDKASYEACFGAGSFDANLSTAQIRAYEEGEDENNPLYLATYARDPLTGFFAGDKVLDFQDDASNFCMKWVTRGGVLTDQASFVNMAGKTIIYDFRLKFDYDNFSQVYTYRFKLEYQPYENFRSDPEREILAIDYYDADTGLPITDFCDLRRLRVEVTLDVGHGSDGTNWKLRPMIDQSPYGVGFDTPAGFKEFDGYASVNLIQLQQDPIEYAEEFFTDTGKAHFIVNMDLVPFGEPRRVYAIAQKTI